MVFTQLKHLPHILTHLFYFVAKVNSPITIVFFLATHYNTHITFRITGNIKDEFHKRPRIYNK